MNHKLTKIANWLSLITAIMAFAFSLFLMIKSFAKYDDGYGIDYSFNKTYVIASIVTLIFCSYNLLKIVKPDVDTYYHYHVTMSINSFLISFYSLGSFFKSLFKAIVNKKQFIFMNNYAFLFIGLVTLGIAIYFIIKTIAYKCKK